MAPSPQDYLVSGIQLLSGFRTKAERYIASERTRDISGILNTDTQLRVLDLANGALQPQYRLLVESGYEAYGIDLINRPIYSVLGYAYRLARWLYNRHIDYKNGNPPHRLVCGNVTKLPFSNNSFDLVTSVAAFEHFLDVPPVIEDIHRVLRPGGVAWIRIHPFACLSGGHNLSFTEIPIQDIPKGIDPWDHLRHRKLALTVPLNEWRIGQFLESFDTHFNIVLEYCALREGEHLLTSSLEDELKSYSRDELTCASYVIVAQKSK